MFRSATRTVLCLAVLAVVPMALRAAGPSKGWPSWRGPNRDGISTETGLLRTWPKEGPPLLWQMKGLGRAYSSVSISGGKIFTMGSRRRSTDLIALDLKTGKELWSAKVGGGNPNCTPTVDGGLVFALGRNGDLVCAKTGDGSIVWKKNFPRDFGGQMMSTWGYSESPLVDGDRLVCTPGAGDAMIVALNKKTGNVIWKASMPDDVGDRGKDGAGYSSIVISHAAGVKQYVQLTGRGIISVAAKDGKTLWTYNRIANRTANIPTPIVTGDYVFCSTGYYTGAALLKIVKDGSSLKAEEVYFLESGTLQNHHGGMVLVDGYVYCGHGHGQGYPICVELKTGKVKWGGGRTRGPGRKSAAVVYADGHLYFRYENGVMALIEATPKEYRLNGSFKLASVHGPSWPHPVIYDGKLYLRDNDNLMCYDIKRK
jgi:outer membrane protein assembly factor BamB